MSLSPSPVEGGAGLGLQLVPEAEALGHHAGVILLDVGAADDAALPMRAAPRVGQEELWGREDTGVTTDTATLNPASPVYTGAVRQSAPWDTACPVNPGTGKQQETGVLLLGTGGSWRWGQGTAVSAVALLHATAEGSQVCRHLPQPVGNGDVAEWGHHTCSSSRVSLWRWARW